MITVASKQRLEQLTAETNIEEINEVFQILIGELQSYLGLAPARSKVSIRVELTSQFETLQNSIFSAGVKRLLPSNLLIFFKEYSTYFPPLLLREAYNCFLPLSLLTEKYVQIIIHQLVVNNLSTFKLINEWKTTTDQKIVDLQFIRANFDRFKKFLENRPRVQLLFQFLREKELVIESMGDALYGNIVNTFMWTSARAINDDELLETVRVLANLFQDHKEYTSQEEYVAYCQQYSKEGKTNQSQRQFVKNMGWIKDHSSISPSYQVNWMYMNVALLFFYFKFNPFLKRELVLRIMERIPFLAHFQRFRTNISTEISGYFHIPLVYLKDFLGFIQKMGEWGYLLEKNCLIIHLYHNFLNINYFREFHKSQKKLINIEHRDYQQKYELEGVIEYRNPSSGLYPRLSILDLNILQRARNLSFTGFTFEKRRETLDLFREDLHNIITSEENVVHDIQALFEQLDSNPTYRSELLRFIDSFKETGFIYIHFLLENLLKCLKCISDILSKNSEFTNIFQLREYIERNGLSSDLKTNILMNDRQLNHMLFHDLMPFYFQSPEASRKKFETFQFFHAFFMLCDRIKVFDLHVIRHILERKEERERIYSIRQEKLTNYYEIFNPSKLTTKHIEAKVKEFIEHEPPVLKPMLINTIATSAFCNYFPQLILNDTPETRKMLQEILKYFPRSLVQYTQELFTKQKQINILLYLPNIKQKKLFLSILKASFADDLLLFSRNYTGGLLEGPYTFVDFYNFDTHQIFYNKDLFDQFFLYVTKSLGELPEIPIEVPYRMDVWYTDKTMKDLSKKVEKRYLWENKSRDRRVFDDLLNFHEHLRSHLIQNSLSPNISPVRDYIKSISFLPAFHRFGLSQYYLFVHPLRVEDPATKWTLDWKLLLGNTFQTIQYPVRLGASSSLFLTSIFPYHTPNATYLNWLAKSKKVIREYFLFSVKRISQLFHFDCNLNEEYKWNYDADRFEIHLHHILFHPDYRRHRSPLKQFDLGSIQSSEILGPDSEEFRNLTTIYSWKAADLFPYYYRKNTSAIQLISDLIQKELIFPFLTLKNLNFIEKVSIILPQVSKEIYPKLLQIFDFFNYGFISEIEGQYYIYGMDKEITFENGLMIELYFPDCKMYQFQELFEQLFHYLKIDHYLILNDLVDGKPLLRSIYGDDAFLNEYNPLTNLIWNQEDRQWMNHKLFNETFEPLYPPLFFKKE